MRITLSLLLLFALHNVVNAQEKSTGTPSQLLSGSGDTINRSVQNIISRLNKYISATSAKGGELSEPIKRLWTSEFVSIDGGHVGGQTTWAEGMYNGQSITTSASVGVNASVKGVPLNVDVVYNNYPSFNDMRSVSRGVRVNVNFDHERYLNDSKKRLTTFLESVDPDVFIDSSISNYKDKLIKNKDGMRTGIKDYLSKQVPELSQYQNMIQSDSLDLQVLRNQMNSSVMKQRYQSALNKAREKAEGTLDSFAVKNEKELKFIDSLNRLLEWYHKNEEKINEVNGYIKDVKADVIKQLNEKGGSDMEELKKMFNRGGIQELISKLSKLKIGNISLDESPGASSLPFSINGISTGFDNKGSFGGFEVGSVAQPYTTSNRFDNALSTLTPDSAGRNKTPMFWRIQYGIGQRDGEHLKFSLSSLGKTNSSPGNSYQVSIGGASRLFKETWLKLDLSKNLTSTGNVGNSTSKLLSSLTDNNLQSISVKSSAEGNYEKLGLKWTAGLDYIPANYFAFTGLASMNSKVRYYVSLKQEAFRKKLLINAKIDNRKYLNPVSSNSTNIHNNSRFQVKYKFKRGQYVSMQLNPFSSVYNSMLRDSSVMQRLSGRAWTLNGNLRRRIGGRTVSLFSGLDYYTNKQLMPFNNLQDSAGVALPFRTIGSQVLLDAQVLEQASVYVKNTMLFPLNPGNNGQPVMAERTIMVESGYNFILLKSVSATSGLSYNYRKNYNSCMGMITNISLTKSKWSVSLNSDIKFLSRNRSEDQWGFGNRVDATYQYKF